MDWGIAAFVLALAALAVSVFGLFAGRKEKSG